VDDLSVCVLEVDDRAPLRRSDTAHVLGTTMPILLRSGPFDAPSPVNSRITFDCSAVDDAAIRTAMFWLAARAAEQDFDAVIVVPTLHDADCLACVFPFPILHQLVNGNIVRLNRGSLFLVTAREVMPQSRRHHVVLALGLTDDELARVDRMNPAALCVVRRAGHLTIR
jgi:hypothetical protein